MRYLKFTQKEKQALCRQAPEFRPIVRQVELRPRECGGDLFLALVESVVSQQLAVKAADAIFRRVETLLGNRIEPEALLAADPEKLRACGLSGRKVEYLRGIAEARISGTVDFDSLAEKPDAEVITELVKLKGVGVWTAEMLLLFALGRRDILSSRDLGIRRGIMMLNGLDDLSDEQFEFYRRRYSPYGSLASLYLWRIKDGGLAAARTSAKPKKGESK
ncbi:MAG: DNA-3-methyladenine glycosylase 2 family protein [Lentisphaeria bacterium]|nr:DNA-3-methyladenine glycosylase 2 family protein [Lentisphaeria bacterium]